MKPRDALKRAARALATLVMTPAIGSFHLRSWILGADRALEGSAQLLSLVPGLPGQYLRRAFLTHAIAYCHPSAVIEFGTLFSSAATRIDENVYIGPRCHIGSAH